MTEFVVLSRFDMLALCDDKPVTIYINNKPYVLCTDEYFEKQAKREDTELNPNENGVKSELEGET